MTFQDLLKKYGTEAIIGRLGELYDDIDGDAYKGVIGRLLSLEAVPSDGVIHLLVGKEDIDQGVLPEDKWWVDVSGRFPDDEDNYSLGFTPWAQWLGMEIAPSDLPPLDIICHCIWDMTFYGMEEGGISEWSDIIKERAEDAKEHPERMIPMDEVMDKYGLGDDD